MSHSRSTTHYDLPQFNPTDKPAWLSDINQAFAAIDEAIYLASQGGGGGGDISLKTINGESIKGIGDIELQTPLISGSSINTGAGV